MASTVSYDVQTVTRHLSPKFSHLDSVVFRERRKTTRKRQNLTESNQKKFSDDEDIHKTFNLFPAVIFPARYF